MIRATLTPGASSISYRVTVGPKGLAEGNVEVVRRKTGKGRDLPVQRAAGAVAETIFEERGFSSAV